MRNWPVLDFSKSLQKIIMKNAEESVKKLQKIEFIQALRGVAALLVVYTMELVL